MLDLHSNDHDAWVIARLLNNMAGIPETRELARSLMRAWVDEIAAMVRQEQADGRISPNLDAPTLAAVLVGSFDGTKNIIELLNDDPRDASSHLANAGALLAAMVRNVGT